MTPPVREALDRHQVWGYLVALLAGLGLGMTRPEAAGALEGALWPLLGLLLYATFTQVPLGRLGLAARDWRFGAALLAGNFLILPLAVGALVLLLPLAPAVWWRGSAGCLCRCSPRCCSASPLPKWAA